MSRSEIVMCSGVVALSAALMTTVAILAPGPDLQPLYVAARMIGGGDAPQIYHENLTAGFNEAWRAASLHAGFDAGVPWFYVMPPLWAWLVAPLAAAVSFETFHIVFAVLNVAALTAAFAVAARIWTPGAEFCRLLAFSMSAGLIAGPVLLLLAMNQVQAFAILFMLLAVERWTAGRPAQAGLALALAAGLKLAPALFALYWLIRGRWSALIWFAGGLFALVALNVIAVGPDTIAAYRETIGAMSDSTVVYIRNQSLPLVLLQVGTGLRQAGEFLETHPLPLWAKLAGAGVFLGACFVAAWRGRARPRDAQGALDAGVLVAAALAAPVAWTHYFAFLVPLTLALPRLWGWSMGLPLAALVCAALLLYAYVDFGNPQVGLWAEKSVTLAAVVVMIALLAVPAPALAATADRRSRHAFGAAPAR